MPDYWIYTVSYSSQYFVNIDAGLFSWYRRRQPAGSSSIELREVGMSVERLKLMQWFSWCRLSDRPKSSPPVQGGHSTPLTRHLLSLQRHACSSAGRHSPNPERGGRPAARQSMSAENNALPRLNGCPCHFLQGWTALTVGVSRLHKGVRVGGQRTAFCIAV